MLDGPPLPDKFARWFAERGWQPRDHQLALLAQAEARRSCLLIAPTGAGKTLAGFLPSLVELDGAAPPRRQKQRASDRFGPHTLYISPLKALATDVARNLLAPVAEMELAVRIETRTGDTPPQRRQRQRQRPPDILLTTPEQVALLLSHADAPALFSGLRAVILDELHALAPSKRGDLLALDLARLRRLAPGLVSIGLSATVARPSELRAYLAGQPAGVPVTRLADLIVAAGGAAPEIAILETAERIPWSGHSARHAAGEIYQAIKAHRLALVFVNTRSQAELVFNELWRVNEDNVADRVASRVARCLPVAARSRLPWRQARLQARWSRPPRWIWAWTGAKWTSSSTSGAPKGASRLIQRVGRANHRLEEASRALLVPGNRFEVLECRAAHRGSRGSRRP